MFHFVIAGNKIMISCFKKLYVSKLCFKKPETCFPELLKTVGFIVLPINQRLSRACIVHLVIKRTNWSYAKTMSCSGRHLGIPINIKNTKFVKSNDWCSLGSISAIVSEKKIFLYFPIWSCLNTMTCGGSHLGFPIGIKNRGPSNDHSWAVWFQLSKWFQRRSILKHFSHRVQC